MKTKVVCHVATCTHQLPGDLCGAKNIDILNQVPEGAGNKTETKCKTFYRKEGLGDYLRSADNVNWGGIVSGVFTTGARDIHPSITCTVNNCQYWSPANLCHADAIEVTGHAADRDENTNCNSYLNKRA